MSNIVELPTATLEDVAFVLRSIADCIEDGDYGDVSMGAVVIRNTNGKVEVFGAGGADFYRGITLFNLGINELINGSKDE